MDGSIFQPLALSTAFWVALFGFHARAGADHFGVRPVIALALGALFAHLGWAALYAHLVRGNPASLLAPTGFSVLFVPLGLLAAAPWRAPRDEREAFLAAAFGALPLALATARLGCITAACCGPLVAVALDATGLVALHALVRRTAQAWTVPLVMIGFGALRLALEPLRDAAPLGAPLVPVAALAAAWVALGAAIAGYRICGGGLATSRRDTSAKLPLRST
jgi:hypothetical protein